MEGDAVTELQLLAEELTEWEPELVELTESVADTDEEVEPLGLPLELML